MGVRAPATRTGLALSVIAGQDTRAMAAPEQTDLLVVGAGPYGLATAAEARRLGVPTVVLGDPMGFWRENMPAAMLLRSGRDWHLDAAGEHTFDAYVEAQGLDPGALDPIPIDVFIGYADWFTAAKGIEPRRERVRALVRRDGGGGFEARMEGGSAILADRVVAAPGIADFAVEPALVREALAPGQWSHTARTVEFDGLRGRRCLILGGRQSAFEWAALLAEAGAERVDVVHRHDTPEFTPSDWSFVDDLLVRTRETRGWFRRLGESERAAIAQRFWQVGRLQLEPWLAGRIARDSVHLWPRAEPAAIDGGPGDAVTVTLRDGTRLETDHVLLATGYRVDMRRVPYLPDDLALADGFPVLDEDFQTNLEGLYIPGFPSTRDFGPFFGFVAGATTTAAMIGAALER
jgi:cation diffusion facilitator CzcD-associated flavoprotein CzcO